jgi:hypothetical protein
MRVLPLLFAAATVVVACPEHNELDSRVARRAEGTKDWDYHTSYDWGMKNKSMFTFAAYPATYTPRLCRPDT